MMLPAAAGSGSGRSCTEHTHTHSKHGVRNSSISLTFSRSSHSVFLVTATDGRVVAVPVLLSLQRRATRGTTACCRSHRSHTAEPHKALDGAGPRSAEDPHAT